MEGPLALLNADGMLLLLLLQNVAPGRWVLQVLDQHVVWLQVGQVGYGFLTEWTQSWGTRSGQVE